MAAEWKLPQTLTSDRVRCTLDTEYSDMVNNVKKVKKVIFTNKWTTEREGRK
jgi:hypothetical protein